MRSDRKAMLHAESQIARKCEYDMDLFNGLEKRLRQNEASLWPASSERLCFVERSCDSLIFHQPDLVGCKLFSYVGNRIGEVVPNAPGKVDLVGHADLFILLEVTADPNQ
ncbi:MAG: hypothetical protein JWQ49_1577 [Edaphobacter sp.]|nr:hypothetical protein [Edaphobacter sp.]